MLEFGDPDTFGFKAESVQARSPEGLRQKETSWPIGARSATATLKFCVACWKRRISWLQSSTPGQGARPRRNGSGARSSK